SWKLYRNKNNMQKKILKSKNENNIIQNSIAEASWNDVVLEDPIKIEIGNALIPMVDINQNGDLLDRIRIIRKKNAQEMGFLPPLVHIKNNINLTKNMYKI
ncbi:MAG: FHIPEP family type III secretion protein, partial [Buchnera aphidicola]|nr:FHIPEP family type III secretion protein [Buchnera aphidicola]